MKKMIFIVAIFITTMLLMTSCILDSISDGFEKHKKGVVEEKEELLGVYRYECTYVGKDWDHAEGIPYENEYGDTEVYWEDESCASLGYKHAGDMTFFHKDGSEHPGENGYWANGGDNPNTPAFCTGYIAPTSDVQLNSYCENAYNARCILGVDWQDERVTSSCANYNGFLQMDPSLPECNYCNQYPD